MDFSHPSVYLQGDKNASAQEFEFTSLIAELVGYATPRGEPLERTKPHLTGMREGHNKNGNAHGTISRLLRGSA
jgi:hypothetical protein